MTQRNWRPRSRLRGIRAARGIIKGCRATPLNGTGYRKKPHARLREKLCFMKKVGLNFDLHLNGNQFAENTCWYVMRIW